MLLTFKQLFVDESGQLLTVPIVVKLESISCIYPAVNDSDSCFIMLDNGSTITINDSFHNVQGKIEKSNKQKVKKSNWIPVSELTPDVDDDYIVSIGRDQYRSYSSDVDSFRRGRWKNYGNKVVAWMPFPEPFTG